MGVYGMSPDSILTPSSILPEEEKEDLEPKVFQPSLTLTLVLCRVENNFSQGLIPFQNSMRFRGVA